MSPSVFEVADNALEVPTSIPNFDPSSVRHLWKSLWSRYDDDYDDDAQRSPSNSRWRTGIAGVSVGVMTPTTNNLLQRRWLALLASCTYTLMMTVRSTSNIRENAKG